MEIYWLLPMILFLGAITSYEDIRHGKIRNKWVAAGILYSLFVYLILVYSGSISIYEYYLILLNGIFALVTGFIIWMLKFWTAGDAKLFFVFSLLAYSNPSNPFSFGDILINSFIPVGLYLAAFAIIKVSSNSRTRYLKHVFNPKIIVYILLITFVLMWPVAALSQKISLDKFLILIVLFMVLAKSLLENFLEKKTVWVLVFLASLRALFDKTLADINIWTLTIKILVIILVIRMILIAISRGVFTKQIPLAEIKEGMIPDELIVISKKGFQKRRISLLNFFSDQMFEIFKIRSGGFTKNEVEKIHSIAKKSPFKYLRIQQTFSFAPFLFSGVLIYMMLSRNILSYLF